MGIESRLINMSSCHLFDSMRPKVKVVESTCRNPRTDRLCKYSGHCPSEETTVQAARQRLQIKFISKKGQ